MTWKQINERLLAIEWGDKKEGWEKEWNSLLDIPIAGVIKRDKYEESKGKEEGEGSKEERREREDVGVIQSDMVGETTS